VNIKKKNDYYSLGKVRFKNLNKRTRKYIITILGSLFKKIIELNLVKSKNSRSIYLKSKI